MKHVKSFDSFNSINESQQLRKSDLDAIREEIDEAYRKIAEKHGWKSFKASNFTYHDGGFSLTSKCQTGFITDAVKRYLQSLGMSEEIIGKEIVHKNKTYIVDEITPHKKYQIVCVLKDDPSRTMSFGGEFFKSLLPEFRGDTLGKKLDI